MATPGDDSPLVAAPAQPGQGALSGRRRSHWATRTYLVAIIVLTVLTLLGASVYAFLWSSSHARSAAVQSMDFRAGRAAEHVSSAVVTTRTTVSSVADQPGISAVFQDADGCQLTATGLPAFSSVRLDLVAADGAVVCSSDPAVTKKPRVHAGSDWLTEAMSRGPLVRWDGQDAVTGQPSIVVSSPVQKGNRTVGPVVGFLHLPLVGDDVAKDLEGARGSTFTLVDTTDNRVVSTSALPVGSAITG